MKVSSIFENMQEIPLKYTYDGDNINPLLEVEEIPYGTKTIVIIVDDPDASSGTFTHWLVWDIFVNEIIMRVNEKSRLGIIGINDFGNIKYDGPCPPKHSGKHHYFFKVYALNSELELSKGSTKQELERIMQGKIIEKATLIGIYSRDY